MGKLWGNEREMGERKEMWGNFGGNEGKLGEIGGNMENKGKMGIDIK